MRKTIVLIFLPVFLFSYPAINGGRGFYRIQDTKSEGQGMLSLSVHNLIQREKGWYQLGIYGGVTYAPLEWLEFIAGPSYGIWSRNLSFDTLETGFYDTKIGAKFTFKNIPVFKLGLMGYGSIPTMNNEEFQNAWGVSGNRKTSIGFLFLTGLDFGDISTTAPFNIVFNAGYLKGDKDSIYLGIGTELPAKGYAVTLEIYTPQPLDYLFNFDSSYIILTPGVKFKFPFGGGIDLGLDVRFGGNISMFQGIVGVNLISPFLKPAPPPTGIIAGSVVDAVTGKPLGAEIIFADTSLGLPSVKTNPSTGVFTVENVPVGVVTIVIKKEGYKTQSIPVVVKKNETTTQTIELLPLKLYGSLAITVKDAKTKKPLKAKVILEGLGIEKETNPQTGFIKIDSIPTGVVAVKIEAPKYIPEITSLTVKPNQLTSKEFLMKVAVVKGFFFGQVLDKKTKKPLKAKIIFKDTNIPPIETEPETGIFKAEVPPGNYAVVVHAEGYIDQPAPVVIEEDKTTERNFELVKKGMTFTFRNIYFDFNKATIRPESYPALDEMAKILKENPNIKVEIQGHTCSIGSYEYNMKLSQARAEAVVHYLVTHHGIDIRRLIARGYGESRPIADNSSEAGRRLNRRVEFVILGEMEE